MREWAARSAFLLLVLVPAHALPVEEPARVVVFEAGTEEKMSLGELGFHEWRA